MASTRCEMRGRHVVVCAAALVLVVWLAWWSSKPQLPVQDGAPVSVSEVDDESSEGIRLPAGEVTTYETGLELPDASQELVERYRDRGDCLMRQAGYLDLFGDAWSCVVQGPDWVDLCVVSAASDDAGSVVRVQRLERPDADGWWER